MKTAHFDTNALNQLLLSEPRAILNHLRQNSIKIIVPDLAYFEVSCNPDKNEALRRLRQLGVLFSGGDRIVTHISRPWQSIITAELLERKRGPLTISAKLYSTIVRNILNPETWLFTPQAENGKLQIKEDSQEMLQIDRSAREYLIERGASFTDENVDEIAEKYVGIGTPPESCFGFPEFLYQCIISHSNLSPIACPSFFSFANSDVTEFKVTKTWINMSTLHVIGTLYSTNASRIFKPRRNDWMDKKIASISASGDYFVTNDERLRAKCQFLSRKDLWTTTVVNFDQFMQIIE